MKSNGCVGRWKKGNAWVHPDLDDAPSDGPNMINFEQFDQLLQSVARLLEAMA